MIDDNNPFTKLGLQKEVVESLQKQGRLEEFLRTYYRSIQVHVHPDKGGDSALAAAINAAYDTIQRQPSSVGAWIQSMSNGDRVNSEYLVIIEGLTAKVEELQGVEKEYRNLQEQYATLLASRTGDGTKSKVRTAAPKAKREDVFSEDIDEDLPSSADAPEVKRPRAKRVDVDADTVSRTKARERAAPRAEPIVLEKLISYGLDVKPIAKYTAYLDDEAVRGPDGEYLISSQRGFIDYFASGKDGRRLPTAMELYAMIERLHDEKHPALAGLVRDMQKSWLCTGTMPHYTKNIITHHGFGEIDCAIPVGNHWLDEIIKDKKWRKVLQALFGPKDVERVPEVFHAISRKRPYIWTPDAEGRKSLPERAVWLNIYADRSNLNGGPFDSLGRSRGVRVESA